MGRGVAFAVASALLFGASTPLAKLLLGDVAPAMLAGLLYAGSGAGLGLWLLLRGRTSEAPIRRGDWPWLAASILFGAVLGPLLLMRGLSVTPGSTASLLLNLEAVATAGLAWFVVRESFDRRIFIGMVLIVAGSVVLSWPQGGAGAGLPWGSILVAAACLCWGIDNNLTRKVSAADPVQIAAVRGGVAAVVNLAVGLSLGAPLPAVGPTFGAGVVGLLGYGVSLVLFVLALRHLGTARTGAYYALAPFAGAGLSLALLGEAPGPAFWVAASLMAAGVWLHLTERHAHAHVHEPMAHDHAHVHDAHHRHAHDFAWDGTEPHAHPHRHGRLVHSHAHMPDLHHRHDHG